MEFLEVFGRLWASLTGTLGGEGVTLVVVAVLAVLLTVVWRVHASIVKTEWYKKNQVLWEMVDDKIADMIFLIANGEVDLAEYEVKSEQRVAEGLPYVDPRMLYLLDRVEAQVNTTFKTTLDFEALLARAERIFDEVKNDPTTSVGGEPVMPVGTIVE